MMSQFIMCCESAHSNWLMRSDQLRLHIGKWPLSVLPGPHIAEIDSIWTLGQVSPENPSVCLSALIAGFQKIPWKLLGCLGGNITLKIHPCFQSHSVYIFFTCINKEERASAPWCDLTLLQSSSVCVSPSPADRRKQPQSKWGSSSLQAYRQTRWLENYPNTLFFLSCWKVEHFRWTRWRKLGRAWLRTSDWLGRKRENSFGAVVVISLTMD